MLKSVLTILAIKGSYVPSSEVKTSLELIVKKTKKDKLPFRGTQTRFDKRFYNFVARREQTFMRNDKALISSMQDSSNQVFLSITPAGKKYLLSIS